MGRLLKVLDRAERAADDTMRQIEALDANHDYVQVRALNEVAHMRVQIVTALAAAVERVPEPVGDRDVDIPVSVTEINGDAIDQPHRRAVGFGDQRG